MTDTTAANSNASPLTGNVIDSNVGGYFAPFLKFSGFDALEPGSPLFAGLTLWALALGAVVGATVDVQHR